ncbi:MAG TPA: phage tail tube protein [Patescibacteria group bacterium]|nr:phage tail tube protein [Patescibacteria group bacterium]
MASQNGRDLLLKIGDGAAEESFAAIGAARTTSMTLDNRPVDATRMDAGGVQQLIAGAGVQVMQLRLDGLFKDAAAEARLRAAAMNRSAENYLLCFPNGDTYAARFIVTQYARGGSFDGLESFSAVLLRSGAGIFSEGGA